MSINETFDDPAVVYDAIVGFFRGIITPLLCVVGLFGNTFIVIIFSKETKISRFSVYCITLAITHSLALFTNGFLDDFLGRGLAYVTHNTNSIWKFDVLSNMSCKLMEYLPNSFYFASSALLVVFSIDRLLTIYQPIKLFAIYYINFAISICCFCLLAGFILNIPLFISYSLIKDKYHSLHDWKYKCDMIVSRSETKIISRFAIYTKLFGAFIIPTFIVLVLNTIIIYKFRLLNQRFCLVSDENQNRNLKSTIKLNSTGIFSSKYQNKDSELSRICGHIYVNSAFLLLTLPLVIVIILRIHSENHNLKYQHPYYYNSLKHLSRLFSSIKDINYASNFFVYMKFLPNFYDGFIEFWKKCCLCCVSTKFNDKNRIMEKILLKKSKLQNEIVFVPEKLSKIATQTSFITFPYQQN